MRNVARLLFLLLGVVFVVAVISHKGNTPRPDMTTAGSPQQESAAPVVIPAVPTNTYLSLPPDDLFAHARELTARMYDANRHEIRRLVVRWSERRQVAELSYVCLSLSLSPPPPPPFHPPQLLALVKRRTEEGECAVESLRGKGNSAQPQGLCCGSRAASA